MSTTDETVEKLAADLGKLRSSINRDATILLIVAVILFALFLGYFIYGFNKFKEISEPNLLMDAAEAVVNENITEVRKHLQNEVTQNAEKWAQQLSENAIKSVPSMRENLENFVAEQIHKKMEESVDRLEPEFDKLISQNNEVLKKAFADLKKDENISSELVDIIANEVDTRLKSSVQADAEQVLNNMIHLRAKMRKLKKGEGLTDEERLERQILEVARQIQLSNEK